MTYTIRTALFVAVALAAGCSPDFQSVRMDIPVGATVRIPEGVHTLEKRFRTPFVGRFEIGSTDPLGGFPLDFYLEGEAARRYGADRAIHIYARLSVGKPTSFSKSQTLRLAPSEDKIRALVEGSLSEIEAFVVDPNADDRRLAVVTMRMAPF